MPFNLRIGIVIQLEMLIECGYLSERNNASVYENVFFHRHLSKIFSVELFTIFAGCWHLDGKGNMVILFFRNVS